MGSQDRHSGVRELPQVSVGEISWRNQAISLIEGFERNGDFATVTYLAGRVGEDGVYSMSLHDGLSDSTGWLLEQQSQRTLLRSHG
jgi:hypothetical protein